MRWNRGHTLSVQTHNYFCLRVKTERIISTTVELKSVGDQRTEEDDCRVGSFKRSSGTVSSTGFYSPVQQKPRNLGQNPSSRKVSQTICCEKQQRSSQEATLERCPLKVSYRRSSVRHKNFKPLILKGSVSRKEPR